MSLFWHDLLQFRTQSRIQIFGSGFGFQVHELAFMITSELTKLDDFLISTIDQSVYNRSVTFIVFHTSSNLCDILHTLCTVMQFSSRVLINLLKKFIPKRFFHKFEKYAIPWNENTSAIVYVYDLVANQL